MVRINNEKIIVSLMEYGFDIVDPLLFSYVLGKLTLDNRKLNTFLISEEPFCGFFNEVMVYDELGYHLKDGLKLDSKYYEGSDVTIRQILNISPELINYFNSLDFRDVVLHKITLYGNREIDELSNHFCEKEKEIIKDMFKIGDNPKKVEQVEPKKDESLKRMLFIPRKDL